ncbi:hypothetical protein QNM99_18745 [Pseudomonas sp. PCH446]
MKTVSFQGSQLTQGQRLRLEQQQRVKAFMSPVLVDLVSDTIKALDIRKEQGVKPERVWFVERQETGTTCIAEWMGF